MKNIRGWSNIIIRVCPMKLSRELKQKSYVLEIVFIHGKLDV